MDDIKDLARQEDGSESMPKWWEAVGYQDAKGIILDNMNGIACNSIAIGYYLCKIKGDGSYQEDRYENFESFIRTEYAMSYSTATRLISLCERFSKGGNSPVLDKKYREYQKSALIEMLTIPEDRLEEVTPDMTVQEIRDLKRTIREPEPVEPMPAELPEPEISFTLERPNVTVTEIGIQELMQEDEPEEQDEEAAEAIRTLPKRSGNPQSAAETQQEEEEKERLFIIDADFHEVMYETESAQMQEAHEQDEEIEDGSFYEWTDEVVATSQKTMDENDFTKYSVKDVRWKLEDAEAKLQSLIDVNQEDPDAPLPIELLRGAVIDVRALELLLEEMVGDEIQEEQDEYDRLD